MKQALLIVIGVTALFVRPDLSLAENGPKRTLNNNYTEVYHILPPEAGNIRETLAKGMFYARLRMNSFLWYWDQEEKYDPKGFGAGGSLIFKTAPFYGLSVTAGYYATHNLSLLDRQDALYGASGRDTFSRYNAAGSDDWGMDVLAQFYLQYSFFNADLKFGRQVFESYLLRSNDSKMIPNTFLGLSLEGGLPAATSVKAAYFTRQKARGHSTFHDVITYGDGSGSTYGNWDNQDDSAVHKGLSYDNLKAAGKDTDNDLLVFEIQNKAVKNLRLDASYTGAPHLFYSLIGEINYTVFLANGFRLIPGLRYLRQFDDGAGDVGGAALSGKASSLGDYCDPDSVDGQLYAARLVLKKGAGSLSAGYSHVADEADLIAPWRGFPTAGYTRSMAQYNWYADTDSWMLKGFYDFGKAGLLQGVRGVLDFAVMDFDEQKYNNGGKALSDRRLIHADIWYQFPSVPGLEAKFRTAFAFDDDEAKRYNEFRWELNYLF